MPYYTCSRCRLSYYSAASWAYVPECPRCYQPLNRPSLVPDRVVSISRGTRRDERDTSRSAKRNGLLEAGNRVDAIGKQVSAVNDGILRIASGPPKD